MNWELVTAKNGEQTLILNNIYLYSRYRPREDAWRWVESEFDPTKNSYLLIGLGLGYHLEKLVQLANGKQVFVFYFEKQEKKLFNKKYQYEWDSSVHFVDDLTKVNIDSTLQLLLANVWIKAIGIGHALVPYLEDIKINQVTYKKNAGLMEENFQLNRALEDFTPYPIFSKRQAALVASGPSLNETIHWLKEVESELAIFVVGSALKMVLAHQIKPSAVILSDPKPGIQKQLQNVNYDGPLFYLSTVNHGAVQLHKGQRYMLLQQGYDGAEELAKEIGFPLIETGGSVATTTLSLLEILNFSTVFLFGLDLGFRDDQTHANHSTSGRRVLSVESYKEVLSNKGDSIYTTPNLDTYLRWVNEKMERTKLIVYNTAIYGAKLNKVPYINQQQFHKLIESENL